MEIDAVTIPKWKLEELEAQARKLKELEGIDFDLVKQFLKSKEDLKHGRFKRLA